MTSNLLPSELEAVNQLPQEILDRNPITASNEFALSQLAQGMQETDPLPKYKPHSVEFYLNEAEEPAFAVSGDEVVAINLDFFTVKQPTSAVLVIDDIPRYVELNGKEELNTLGEVILPAPLIDSAAQIQLLVQLAQKL